jgi:hypothetical protein
MGNAEALRPPKKAPKPTPTSKPTVPSASFPVSNSSRSHSATPSTASMSKLSEYEKTRNSNIKRNRLLLAAIDAQQRQSMLDRGLDPDAMDLAPAKATKKPAKRKPSMPAGKSAPRKSLRQLKMVREKGREKGPEVVMSEKDRDTGMHSDRLDDIEARTAGAVRDDENDVDMGSGDTEEETIIANTVALGSFTTPQPDVLPIATLPSSTTPQPDVPPIATLPSSTTPQPDVPPIATLPSSTTPQPDVPPIATLPSSTTPQPDVPPIATLPSSTTPQPDVPPIATLPSSTTPQPDVPPIATLPSSTTPQPDVPPIATLPSSTTPQPDVPPIATLPSSTTPQPNVLPVTTPVTTPEQPDISSVANSTTSMQLDTASVTISNSSQSASIGKWLQKPLEEITKCNLNNAYTNTVSLLCDLERAYTFINKTRGFPKVKTECPAQLSHWICDGCGRGSPPIILDVPKFAKVWRDWWSALQPTWRHGEAELV